MFGKFKDHFDFTIEELQDFMAYLIRAEDEETIDMEEFPWSKHVAPNFNPANFFNTKGLILDRIFYRVR